MKFYTKNIFQQARNLRLKGAGLKEISEKFGVNRNTLSRWFFDIPSENPNYLRGEETRQAIKQKAAKYIQGFNVDKNTAKVLMALMYWCEGYKYPQCNCIGFANSDINLIKTFLKLFRMGFNIKEEKFKVHLQLHNTHDKNEVTRFWSKTLSIPESQFYKPTITKPLSKMKRVNYRGTCTIRYYDSALYNEILGIYEGFFKKIVE